MPAINVGAGRGRGLQRGINFAECSGHLQYDEGIYAMWRMGHRPRGFPRLRHPTIDPLHDIFLEYLFVDLANFRHRHLAHEFDPFRELLD